MVVFQHYKTYSEGAEAWERRKVRVDYDHIGYIFHINQEQYEKDAREFMGLNLQNSLVITEGFSMPGAITLNVEPGDFAFTIRDGHPLIIKACDFKKWRENG